MLADTLEIIYIFFGSNIQLSAYFLVCLHSVIYIIKQNNAREKRKKNVKPVIEDDHFHACTRFSRLSAKPRANYYIRHQIVYELKIEKSLKCAL